MSDTVTKRNASTGPYDTNFQVTDNTKQEGIISFSLVQNYRKLAVDVRYLFLRSLSNLSTTQKGLDGRWMEGNGRKSASHVYEEMGKIQRGFLCQ